MSATDHDWSPGIAEQLRQAACTGFSRVAAEMEQQHASLRESIVENQWSISAEREALAVNKLAALHERLEEASEMILAVQTAPLLWLTAAAVSDITSGPTPHLDGEEGHQPVVRHLWHNGIVITETSLSGLLLDASHSVPVEMLLWQRVNDGDTIVVQAFSRVPALRHETHPTWRALPIAVVWSGVLPLTSSASAGPLEIAFVSILERLTEGIHTGRLTEHLLGLPAADQSPLELPQHDVIVIDRPVGR